MSELSPTATVDSRNDCPLRDTPRADALWKIWEEAPLDSTKYAAMFLLAKELENDLELCRDAHMANCLAADTLRTEIRRLRETLSATTSAWVKTEMPPAGVYYTLLNVGETVAVFSGGSLWTYKIPEPQ